MCGRVQGDCTTGRREETANPEEKGINKYSKKFPKLTPNHGVFVAKHETSLWVRNQRKQFILEAGAQNGVAGTRIYNA